MSYGKVLIELTTAAEKNNAEAQEIQLMTINGKWYSLSEIYRISGLCFEDFIHDNQGSFDWFMKCLEKFEDGQ